MASRKNFTGRQLDRKRSAVIRLGAALKVATDEEKRERLLVAIQNTEKNISKIA